MERFHFNIRHVPVDDRPSFRGARAESDTDEFLREFSSDESAARFHLERLLAGDERPGLRSITAPERPGRVPDLRLIDTKRQPGTESVLVRFAQTQDSIPVFGTNAVVEMTPWQALISANGSIGRAVDVSSFPTISQQRALSAILAFAHADPSLMIELQPAHLNFFQDDVERWHLVWLFEDVPVAPANMLEHATGHGLGSSPRTRHPLVDYLVDAHSAEVVYHFSATPLAAAPLPIGVHGMGIDEDGTEETVWGQVLGGQFELRDPTRNITTYDLGGLALETATFAAPFRSASSDLGSMARGIVSAHANATKVHDFLLVVLQRDGIDDLGMELVNVVNCTSPEDEPPPSWHNAVWWNKRMWYGQAQQPDGSLVSMARYLDVIAHELAHGVTESTSDLVYRDESGALNESISDIFGIVIKNWYASPPDGGNVSSWDWELGTGLGQNGLPLRDMSDPSRTGDPSNMADYVQTSDDACGVHTNSNIHNKAAHNVLTSQTSSGERTFTPREVALLYYYALTRLARMDGFAAMRTSLEDVATSMYAGNDADRDAKIAAIQAAYASAGI